MRIELQSMDKLHSRLRKMWCNHFFHPNESVLATIFAPCLAEEILEYTCSVPLLDKHPGEKKTFMIIHKELLSLELFLRRQLDMLSENPDLFTEPTFQHFYFGQQDGTFSFESEFWYAPLRIWRGQTIVEGPISKVTVLDAARKLKCNK